MTSKIRIEYQARDGSGEWFSFGAHATGEAQPGEDPRDTVARLSHGLGGRTRFVVVDNGDGTYDLRAPRTGRLIRRTRIVVGADQGTYRAG